MSIDLNKAFDRVDHGYLYGVLGKVGLGHRMVGWIQSTRMLLVVLTSMG